MVQNKKMPSVVSEWFMACYKPECSVINSVQHLVRADRGVHVDNVTL